MIPNRFCPSLVVLACAAIAGAACRTGETAEHWTTRDSAGVRIAESIAPRWDGEPWVVDSNPRVDLATSGTGPPHEFFRVVDATRMPDGSIAVADRGANEIRVFAADGTYRWTAGGEGEGPGEFRNLTGIARHVSGLVAFDTRLRRQTVVTPDGDVGEITPLMGPGVILRALQPLPDGSIVGVTMDVRRLGEERGVSRRPYHVLRMAPDNGTLADTVLTYPGDEWWELSVGGMVGSFPPVFGRQSHVAFDDTHFVVGTAETMEYRVYSPSGQLETIVRNPTVDLSLSSAELDAARTARLAEHQGGPPMLVDAIADLPNAPSRPAYQNLLIDALGHVWTARYNSGAGPQPATAWDVFTEAGEWLGTVAVPERFTVFEIGPDYLLGMWRDELDVEHVQLLHLDRA